MNLVKDWNRYNKSAEGHYEEEVHFAIKNYFHDRINGKNLDLACGDFPHIPKSIGLDISDVALHKMHGTKGYGGLIQFNLNDLESRTALPFKGNTFDSSTMICGWNYIFTSHLFKELRRVLKKRGRFYIVQFEGPVGEGHFMIEHDRSRHIAAKLKNIGYSPVVEAIYESEIHPGNICSISIQP
jgi:ubiquinone/menaquinone biosynthesis C-methylase UbiE